MEIVYEQEGYAIRGALFEVYRTLGAGFLEEVYQEALERELTLLRIPFESQKRLRISYKGFLLEKYYEADFVCYDKIIVEIKAVKTLLPEHEAQLLNYLKATNMRLGLLVNFNHIPGVDIRSFLH